MDLIFLVGTLLAAIILVVVLIMRLHLHAFVSLVIACFFVGFVTGMPLLQICKSIEAGMGSTLGFLATNNIRCLNGCLDVVELVCGELLLVFLY